MRFNNRDDIIALTPQWKGERFPDGRPKVPDKNCGSPSLCRATRTSSSR